MISTGTELVCPAGKAGDPPLIIDLGAILQSEQRQDEVAFVTPQKAPELLRLFNGAWRDLHKVVTGLASEQLRAERELEKRRAVLILEVVPVVLKERGLGSNEANRDSVITLDEKYQTLQETVDEIDGIVRYLKGKLTSFENAYTSVKKLIGEDATWMQARMNPNLKADSGPTRPVYASPKNETQQQPANMAPKKMGFGKPKY